jgi:hypothetical protein
MKKADIGFARRSGRLLLLGFALLNVAMFWRLHNLIFRGYGDFASFYTAGLLVKSGQAKHLYDRALQWNLQHQFAASVEIRRGPLPYIRPPFEALLFVPFAYISYPVACGVWTAINLAVLLLFPLILPRLGEGAIKPSTVALQMLTCLAFFPAAFCLIQGQDAILLLVVLTAALRLLMRGSEVECGAVLGLGMFKFHLILPILAVLLLRKKIKVVWGFAGTASALFGVSLAMVGWPVLKSYPGYLLSMNEAPGFGMVTKTKSMPNLRGLLALLFRTWHFPMPTHVFLGFVVCVGVVVASRTWSGRDPLRVVAGFCCWISVTLAAAYYSNSYDLTLLLLPLLLFFTGFWSRFRIAGWERRILLAATGLLLCTPLLWVLALPVDQFGWTELLLLALAGSLAAAGWSREAAKDGSRVSENLETGELGRF